MNNTYIVKVGDIKEALDNIDGFEEKVRKLQKKNPEYKFNVSLFKEKDHWVIELNINNGDEDEVG